MATDGKLSPKFKKELYESVIPIASEFRKKFLDESHPIKDTFETLEQLGFFIIRFPSDDNLSGFHLKKGGFDCIFINSAHSLGRQFFSAWHECYHAFTGEVGGGGLSLKEKFSFDEVEFKAECFAGCILMPEPLIHSYIQNKRINLEYVKYEDLIIMQNYFRVSFSALITRLIQIFPHFRNSLSKRYALGRPNRFHEMIEKTQKVDGDTSLIQASNDFVVSQKFFMNLHQNLSEDRITTEKVQNLLETLEGFQKKYE